VAEYTQRVFGGRDPLAPAHYVDHLEWWRAAATRSTISKITMSPELIAIVVTGLLQLVGIVILGWMAHDNGKMLERIDGVRAAIFLPDRQMKEVLDEVRRLLADEAACSPER